jgi:hypothetical protein
VNLIHIVIRGSSLIHEVVAMIVQDFYAWRIWVFQQRTVAASLFCGFIVVVGGLYFPHFTSEMFTPAEYPSSCRGDRDYGRCELTT